MAAFSEASLKIFKPLSTLSLFLPTHSSSIWYRVSLLGSYCPFKTHSEWSQECFIWYSSQGTMFQNKRLNLFFYELDCLFSHWPPVIFQVCRNLWIDLIYAGGIFRSLNPKDKIMEPSNSHKLGRTAWLLPSELDPSCILPYIVLAPLLSIVTDVVTRSTQTCKCNLTVPEPITSCFPSWVSLTPLELLGSHARST